MGGGRSLIGVINSGGGLLNLGGSLIFRGGSLIRGRRVIMYYIIILCGVLNIHGAP